MKNSRSNRSNTGYKGIYQRSNNGKFEVKVELPNKYKQQVGRFNTLEEAIAARVEFIKALF